MRVPFCWLKDYVELHESAQEAAELLQSVGVPVENIEQAGASVSGIVTCRIVSAEKHPDAERLLICQVDAGSEKLQIVTAAPNARAGMVTAVALHGAILASGTKIKKGKLRGAVSEGMFCGWDEAGVDPECLPEDKREGILDLPEDTEIGVPVQKVLPIVEDILIVESFANRADQLSILGIARELAAKLERPLRMPEIMRDYDQASINGEDNLVAIEDYTACPRFMARLVSGVKVGPSPKWMARRLELAGMRSINNVVDITNYVMLETGQPLHAYDRARLAEGRLIVRRSRPEETIVTLDSAEQKLPANSIIIADAEKAVGVAGVMGGLNTEIEEATSELLLESASFDNGDVRRTSLRLGLRTESSKRFEKGMDIERVIFGSQRAAYLLNEYAGKVMPEIVVKSVPQPEPVTVELRLALIKRVLGVEVPFEKVCAILRSLEFAVKDLGDGRLEVKVPSFRIDITEEIDLIEEIARHAGYDNLPNTVPAVEQGSVVFHNDVNEETFRDLCVKLGLTEILTPSLCSLEMIKKYRVEDEVLQIMNPLSEDQRVLRPCLFPFMTNVVLRNLRVRNEDMRLFEISRIYEKDGDGVKEPLRLGLALSYKDADFFALKGIVEEIAAMLGTEFKYVRASKAWTHPGASAEVMLGNSVVGWLGVIHPVLAKELDLEQNAILGELDIDAIMAAQKLRQYKKISRYPSVERDLALVMEASVQAGDVAARFKQVGGDLVSEVRCFDVYVGEGIPAGYKSLAFRFVLQAMDKTLEDEDISRLMKKLQKIAEREFKAKIRE
ncbi:phenylalanine--tRNA ligase subunit beta [bacterium]|nr:phenylalanine--tRNA ligase subunit beta [bacterium]